MRNLGRDLAGDLGEVVGELADKLVSDLGTVDNRLEPST